MKEEKILQAANLSPDPKILDTLVKMHPMRQIFWATIVQVSVFGFMMLAFWTIDLFV